jgi:hypothetical protein
MPNTFELIASSTVGSGGAASIDFTSIPSTFTDLCLKISVRGTSAANIIGCRMAFNGTSLSTNWTRRQLEGNGSTATSQNATTSNLGYPPAANMTASTFSNIEAYIPNYAGSTNKSVSVDSVGEGNSTSDVYADLVALLWSNTAAINQITLTPDSGSFAQYSTAYLYGVKNA